jgi:hypothetical protein
MSRGYKHASAVLTSNKGFEEWAEIFGDEVNASAARAARLSQASVEMI